MSRRTAVHRCCPALAVVGSRCPALAVMGLRWRAFGLVMVLVMVLVAVVVLCGLSVKNKLTSG